MQRISSVKGTDHWVQFPSAFLAGLHILDSTPNWNQEIIITIVIFVVKKKKTSRVGKSHFLFWEKPSKFIIEGFEESTFASKWS